MPSVSAVQNPDLVNDLIDKYVNTDPDSEIIEVPGPVLEDLDDEVVLLGGLPQPSGETLTTAKVRELTGRDEEAIVKANTFGKMYLTILERGVVEIGGKPATKKLLDGLLTGDRDWLLLHIYAATFGRVAEFSFKCPHCQDQISIGIDVLSDVETTRLNDPAERSFTLDCKVGTVEVELANGVTQKELLTAEGKTYSELASILLRNCVVEINGMPPLNPGRVLDLSITDRRKILDEITKRTPGPKMAEVRKDCPSCGEGLETPLTFDALFRF